MAYPIQYLKAGAMDSIIPGCEQWQNQSYVALIRGSKGIATDVNMPVIVAINMMK